MESTPLLYQTLIQVLGCHANGLDVRHFKTLAWMINGLILSGPINLNAWAIDVQSRAQSVQRVIRRFRRFLDNDRIDVPPVYAPLLSQALQGWDRKRVSVALDTSMLWNTDCLVRLSLIYRGRAVPLVGKVLEHGSASVAYEDDQALVDQAAQWLFPFGCQILFLADRGFADTQLMHHLLALGWHVRIRIKESFWIDQPGKRARKVNTIRLAAGHTAFGHNGQITQDRFGHVHLALGHTLVSKERWVVISDEPTSLETFQDYGLRFDIEENCLDDQSNGFQREASLIRSAKALERRCFVLAVTTLYLLAQGTQVVQENKRRLVDPHWFRGSRDLKIGWNWVKRALSKGEDLLTCLALSPEPDPEPAMASRKQHRQRTQPRFLLEVPKAA